MRPNNPKQCEYCHSFITEGQMWVRQKIHKSCSDDSTSNYLYFHADPFPGDTESCWEKFEIKRDLLVLK